MTHFKCGDLVREKGGRHDARITGMTTANGRPLFLNLRWVDTGWRTVGAEAEDYERTPAWDLPTEWQVQLLDMDERLTRR